MVLKPALLEHSENPPELWSELAQGNWLQAQVNQILKPVWPRVFGYHLVTYGGLAGELETQNSHIRHQFGVGTYAGAQVRAEGVAWPFAESSLDAIASVAMLEFERDPHRLLREFSHSLIADGHLILVGMNPLSPAVVPGLWRGGRQAYPWRGRYFTRARVLDWLAVLNYEVTTCEYFAPTWLLPNSDPPGWGITRLANYVPQLGAMYLIVARKREHALKPIQRTTRKVAVNGLKLANYSQKRDCKKQSSP